MKKLTDKELKIMDVLWDNGPLSTRDIITHLPDITTHFNTGKELVLSLQAYRGSVEKIVVVYLQFGINGGGNCEIHNALANIGDDIGMESIGVAFGPDVNARTSFENTQYILSAVPLTGESRIDSCLMILRDWSADAIIDAAALNAERNVIVEEWRARSLSDDGMKLFKERNAGTQYAERNPIGSMDIINTCTADQMRAFYKRWYQPQNQCVIACGDFDPDLMVKKIEKLFGDLKKGSTTVPEFHLPTATEQPFIAVSQSKQVPMAVLQLASLCHHRQSSQAAVCG